MSENKAKHNGQSIAGFVLSLCSYFIFGRIFGILGISLSISGRKKAVQDGDKTGLATAGIVLGVIGLGLDLVFSVLV